MPTSKWPPRMWMATVWMRSSDTRAATRTRTASALPASTCGTCSPTALGATPRNGWTAARRPTMSQHRNLPRSATAKMTHRPNAAHDGPGGHPGRRRPRPTRPRSLSLPAGTAVAAPTRGTPTLATATCTMTRPRTISSSPTTTARPLARMPPTSPRPLARTRTRTAIPADPGALRPGYRTPGRPQPGCRRERRRPHGWRHLLVQSLCWGEPRRFRQHQPHL